MFITLEPAAAWGDAAPQIGILRRLRLRSS
jgi:hypothetical protein